MMSRTLLRSAFLGLLSFSTLSPTFADSNHARIIRLSLVEGDVRFARDVHGDPLTSDKVAWEAAELNLPIRQGYVLATDKGRAEVEFENGAMAFLAENTVLEFYDLSLSENGDKTTRLVLRQGTGSFYVNPANGDYFSVTGGDFTVEAVDRTNFRVDNFDDGSAVNVSKGHVSVRRKDKTTELAKGQSFSMRANDDTSVTVGRLPEDDDFDRWVSGRIDSVASATAAAQQYVNSPSYSSGLAELYTYGSWYPVAGYGNCWRPYGVGLGWSPFASGGWFMDPFFGWSFIGNQPWGWLPYHYGGWVFDPAFGWVWTPGLGGFYGGGFVPWRPVTGIWVRSKPGLLGIVPVHPLDVRGKTPINIGRGIFPVTGGAVARNIPVGPGESARWKPIRSVPRNVLTSNVVASAPPVHVPRTIITTANPGLRSGVPAANHGSSIVYDAGERRFVNREPANQHIARPLTPPAAPPTANGAAVVNGGPAIVRVSPQSPGAPPAHAPVVVHTPRVMTPPPAPRVTENSAGHAGSFAGAGGAGYAPHAAAPAASAASGARSAGPGPAAGSSAPHAASAPAAAGHAAAAGHH
jgi:FecR protein